MNDPACRQDLVRDPAVTGWYTDISNRRQAPNRRQCRLLLRADLFSTCQELLEQIFQDAKAIFAAEIGLDIHGRSLLDSKTSLLDVQQQVLQVQQVYESNSKCKARKWLTALSERIVYYGQVFDVLVQHHPEYVSLAWGTFKFVFIVSLSSQASIGIE